MTEALELQPGVSDGDLARSAAGGDRQAFAEIYDRYADRLFDFCVGLLGDRDAAADCVQDAFCVAAADLGGLREPDKLRPWLYSIARHHAMRRLRHRYREEVSDEVPDMVSPDASPETLAGQSELARLVAEAAGGLSERDRELLDLSYRHGLDGPELAEALGVTLTSANTMMFRLRQTVERCLGALLVARAARTNPQACTELAAILRGWDGQFTVLMRKRMARHIDSCPNCDRDRRRHVNPVALLGGAPVFIPAPDWLRRQTLDRIQLTSASTALTETSVPAAGSRQTRKRAALAVGIPLLCLGVSVAWFVRHEEPVSRIVDVDTDARELPLPVAPAPVVKSPPAPARPRPAPPSTSAQPSGPPPQMQPAVMTGTPDPTPGSVPPPSPAPEATVAPGPQYAPSIDSAPVPDSSPKVEFTNPRADPAPIPNPKVSTTDPKTTSEPDAGVPDTNPPANAPAIPNPGLNPKVISPFPQTNTATITNPNSVPNLQINPNQFSPKPNSPGPNSPKPNSPGPNSPGPKTDTSGKGTNTGSG